MKTVNLFTTYLLCISTFSSCSTEFIKYPYAENNTTKSQIFSSIILDDYQWMELNRSENKALTSWIKAQDDIQNKYFKINKPEISNRIAQLSQISNPQVFESRGDTLFYFKTNIYKKETRFYKYIVSNDRTFVLH